MASEWILYAFLFNQVHIPPKHPLEFFLHIHPIVQAPVSVVGKAHQDVYIAIGAKVVPEHRAEYRQLGDFPLLAKCCDLVSREGNLW
jgi:hypothetical protein